VLSIHCLQVSGGDIRLQQSRRMNVSASAPCWRRTMPGHSNVSGFDNRVPDRDRGQRKNLAVSLALLAKPPVHFPGMPGRPSRAMLASARLDFRVVCVVAWSHGRDLPDHQARTSRDMPLAHHTPTGPIGFYPGGVTNI
jgi:hypothetical protein